ncbi:PucR family transcriptional regulator [Cohnella sp.]|uniref:PucR family transcriptional regulator n=1 Tax=Cohnella sp. TaxID=1883426 RepID=UPI0035615C43
MDAEWMLTVQEALTRPLFQGAQVIAGSEGLDRPIRWVHILETPHFETLIHGQEMILTTGISLNLDAASSVVFMDNLIRQNAACLCIEIGPFFGEATVSVELVALADSHRFPLILFPRTVRFVDITQDLHSLIINRHHRSLEELESLSREFYRLTLTSQGTHNVLKLLHKSTQAQTVLRPLRGKALFAPALPPAEQETLQLRLNAILEEWETSGVGTASPNAAPVIQSQGDEYVVLKPVGALGQTWAYLIMVCPREPREYVSLLLDSASLAIAQELLRTRFLEERKLFSENLWVDELMNGRLDDEQRIRASLGPDFKALNELGFRICLIEIENLHDSGLGHETGSDNEWESIRFHLSLVLRSAFEKHGFRPLITMKNNRLAVVALDLKSKSLAKKRLQQALESLLDLRTDDRLKNLRFAIGIGKLHVHLKNAHAGYQEAVQALSLNGCFHKPILFFEELGVFQLLLGLNDGRTLQAFVRNYLGPLIDHDRAKGSELLLTLRVFLDCDGSKQIASQQLFIVRQSLYYRLEKIAALLGDDFMSPENRIAAQVALRAHQLLHPEAFAAPLTQGGGDEASHAGKTVAGPVDNTASSDY